MSKESRPFATSLFKALDLLSIVASTREGLPIQSLVDAMSLPRTSLLRLLDSLIHYGLVGRDEQKRYFVTDGFHEWRRENPEQQLIKRYAPLMQQITDATGEMTTIGRLSGRRVRHIHCVEPDCRVRVSPPVGRNFPIQKMAMGKLILSVRPDLVPATLGAKERQEIEQIGAQRFAFNRGESEKGIFAWGTWLGAPSPLTPLIAITWPDFRYSEASLAKATALLKKANKPLGPFALFA